MPSFRRWLGPALGAIALLVAAAHALGCAPTVPAYTVPGASPDRNGPIIVLGDTQRTYWGERLLLREQNETARRSLVQKIARDEHPAFVAHVGDMVVYGASAREWAYYDGLMSPLRAAGIPVLPLLGNHDYWGCDDEALERARARSPELDAALQDGGRTYYGHKHGALGFVWLDTNLSHARGLLQDEWFSRQLRQFECDRSIRGIVVFTHAPPFTNGKGRGDDPYLPQAILPRFFRSPKTVAMVSGHVHGYERFLVRGKTFIVTGGGGGPRVCYREESASSHVSEHAETSRKPQPFNYVVLANEGEQIHVTVKCITESKEADTVPCKDGVVEEFSLLLPSPRECDEDRPK